MVLPVRRLAPCKSISEMGCVFVAYSELIKNFSCIRDYMRQFLVYGFRSRDEFLSKSARSYDNEKRRAESWLSGYLSFKQDANGKSVFISVDSRQIPFNPLYKAWKASCFTKNDVSLHFILLDILADGISRSISEILECIDGEYLNVFERAEMIEESTLRKKLREYIEIGLISAEKNGKQLMYRLCQCDTNLAQWRNAVTFFSEYNPLGVIGSFVLDKYNAAENIFSFKHRYLLFTLDSGILLHLLFAMNEQRKIEIEINGAKGGKAGQCTALPLKIYTSVQGGRQYLAAYTFWKKRVAFFRLDSIKKVKILDAVEDYAVYQNRLREEQPHIWGVSIRQGVPEHIEMELTIDHKDRHIAHRLKREKRCGEVVQLDDKTWRFSADVYDAWELLPWIRTFTGRIIRLTCSNKKVEEQFWMDLASLTQLYEGDSHDI